MYNDLLESERKLDWTMARKRIEITDALTKTIKVIPVTTLTYITSLISLQMAGSQDAESVRHPYGRRSAVAKHRR